MSAAFAGSPEAALRSLVRAAIRKSEMTRAERDVSLAIVNLWFHHKSGPQGYIHPGRKLLAKRAGCCEKTVMRSLAFLRAGGALITVSHATGGKHTATRYRVDISALLGMCGFDFPRALNGSLCLVNVPQSDGKMSRNRGDKMSPCNKNVRDEEPEPRKYDNVFAFRAAGGCK